MREELADEGIGVTVLFPGRMTTRHVEGMLSHTPQGEADLTTPGHAIRNLVADLDANEPFSLTHGTYRLIWNRRRDAIEVAFDRMESS